jgi:hypothetical protein
MKIVSEQIPGYSYGSSQSRQVACLDRGFGESENYHGFTDEDERYLRPAGEVLTGQTKQILDHWRCGLRFCVVLD